MKQSLACTTLETTEQRGKKTRTWTLAEMRNRRKKKVRVIPKTQQVVRSRGQHCGDVELVGYLANAVGPVPLVLDLLIAHD